MSTPESTPKTAMPAAGESAGQAAQRVAGRVADVGGIPVSRLLPSRQRRLVGAWCFLDHAGPAQFGPGEAGMQVGPHPHIGLQTFTWMIEGEVLHRDSLGNEQVIRPGQVNLMTAGAGIAHTEQSLADPPRLHAAQLWIALPPEQAAGAPGFEHYPELPRWVEQGVQCTLLAGSYGGRTAPARIYSPLVGVELLADGPATLDLSLDPAFEYAVAPLVGGVRVDGQDYGVGELAYLDTGHARLGVQVDGPARILLLGGVPETEEVFIWWNFVGRSKADIARAQRDWERGGAGRYGDIPVGPGPRLMPPPLPWPGV
ncbi:pirin family protein [Candidimonas nitroreducens]|uniref:Quercetin 2,3-dioxygenase n=1 Tax=Candidimonas nitroreducens TaxID=683354 RepID=A0A225M1G6_9BURK|nr:pirin family protein [Candidimonas nitroreducens]OWT55195.1 quercetin 2,3-dioxygenase [Candidimonas nitroreducens]